VFCWFTIRRVLQPVERTARQIAAKAPDDLSPIAFAGEPRELRPIVLALNTVLARLSRAFETERRFTADAAHELVTPLAALRMRIQLMQRQQKSGGEGAVPPLSSAIQLQDLRDQVDRCTALVDSLLVLTRLDPQTPHSLQTEPVDLASLFAELDDGAAARRNIRVQTLCQVPTLRAHPALLRSALRNLVDNAVRYGAPGGLVQVSAVPSASGIRLAVRDNGPGVSTADRQRLTERFFRVLGTETTGSGLGLSIVSRIAALHGASLSFGEGIDGAGLGVLLDFPP
jgi:two-component system sensor histidine kinase QseC